MMFVLFLFAVILIASVASILILKSGPSVPNNELRASDFEIVEINEGGNL